MYIQTDRGSISEEGGSHILHILEARADSLHYSVRIELILAITDLPTSERRQAENNTWMESVQCSLLESPCRPDFPVQEKKSTLSDPVQTNLLFCFTDFLASSSDPVTRKNTILKISN